MFSFFNNHGSNVSYVIFVPFFLLISTIDRSPLLPSLTWWLEPASCSEVYFIIYSHRFQEWYRIARLISPDSIGNQRSLPTMRLPAIASILCLYYWWIGTCPYWPMPNWKKKKKNFSSCISKNSELSNQNISSQPSSSESAGIWRSSKHVKSKTLRGSKQSAKKTVQVLYSVHGVVKWPFKIRLRNFHSRQLAFWGVFGHCSGRCITPILCSQQAPRTWTCRYDAPLNLVVVLGLHQSLEGDRFFFESPGCISITPKVYTIYP